jgi:hypothetical protein
MYKEAQAAPSPAPIGFIRGGCASCAHIVYKICPQKQKSCTYMHSEVAWGVQETIDFYYYYYSNFLCDFMFDMMI